MNVGSFITSEKETYGIFSDGYAQSVTDEFIFEYEVPGLSKEDIQVSSENNYINIVINIEF